MPDDHAGITDCLRVVYDQYRSTKRRSRFWITGKPTGALRWRTNGGALQTTFPFGRHLLQHQDRRRPGWLRIDPSDAAGGDGTGQLYFTCSWLAGKWAGSRLRKICDRLRIIGHVSCLEQGHRPVGRSLCLRRHARSASGRPLSGHRPYDAPLPHRFLSHRTLRL